MADDWKPGDLALCVNRGPRSPFSVGGIYTVTRVLFGGSALDLHECPTCMERGGWSAGCFRKINPLSIEERNAEIRLLTPVKEDA